MHPIDVSIIVTVYNKERYLPATVRSLLKQRDTAPDLRIEYIFVDDVSTDASLAVIEALTEGVPDVSIVRNSQNGGPSVRLNQGARLARGQYLHFIDSDDILAANATRVMHRLLSENEADVVYGEWDKKTGESGEALLERYVPEEARFTLSEEPLTFVLEGRFLRMALMCARHTYLQAGGADERVFIQDESLPLRLAACARRFISLHAKVMFVPLVEGQLSQNVAQLNHDRFFANYYLLQDYPALPERARKMLISRCISAAWKQARAAGAKAYLGKEFLRYLRLKAGSLPNAAAALEPMRQQFAALPQVRRAGS